MVLTCTDVIWYNYMECNVTVYIAIDYSFGVSTPCSKGVEFWEKLTASIFGMTKSGIGGCQTNWGGGG